MQYTKLYIGSNNETKELEVEKIKDIMYKLGNCGYTLIEGCGIWDSKEEKTAIIEIYGEYNLGVIIELKKQLKQDSILAVEDYREVEFR